MNSSEQRGEVTKNAEHSLRSAKNGEKIDAAT